MVPLKKDAHYGGVVAGRTRKDIEDPDRQAGHLHRKLQAIVRQATEKAEVGLAA